MPTSKHNLRRRWVLVFLILTLLFCLYAVPLCHYQYSTYHRVPIFKGCYLILKLFDPKGLDARLQVEYMRLAYGILIIALVCGIGYMLQNRE